ncbi:uncharacterized protein LOC109827551 [Asparagus officinalis]|uniref:uncharacterized protein LOC109827551 n=1 Tax=Asparagus officinalis TaxID=4686 RepID=UPI00098E5D26|nr:uncharacterized protein LOC109827551 [Asparagus officinalis]
MTGTISGGTPESDTAGKNGYASRSSSATKSYYKRCHKVDQILWSLLNGMQYATIPRSEILLNVEKWNNTLIGYVLGDKPFYSHLKGCVGRLWKVNCSLEIFSRENGFFFFKFGSSEEMNRVLNGGPWLFDGRLIILKQWSENIGLERDLLTTEPVWIRFPSLHLKLWSTNIIGRIASTVGIPIYIDQATASGERLAYARCFVEISSKAKLPNSVRMDLGNGEWLETKVEYEWVPPKCSKCLVFGHVEYQCPVVLVEKWVPKATSDERVKAIENELHVNDSNLSDKTSSQHSIPDIGASSDQPKIVSDSGSPQEDVINSYGSDKGKTVLSAPNLSEGNDNLVYGNAGINEVLPNVDDNDSEDILNDDTFINIELNESVELLNQDVVDQNKMIQGIQDSTLISEHSDTSKSLSATKVNFDSSDPTTIMSKKNVHAANTGFNNHINSSHAQQYQEENDSLQTGEDKMKEKVIDFPIATDNPAWLLEKNLLGRIWIAWDSEVWNGSVLSVTLQQITISLQNNGGLRLILSVIYGENSELRRTALWADISDIYTKVNNMPWLLVGDFNICRFSSEKVGGMKLTTKKLQAFNDCLQLCGLSDIKSTGLTWTWHNNQQGRYRIYGKLDRALGNTNLIDKFPNAFIEYKSSSSSDHTPVIVHLVACTNSDPKPFRFFNYWVQCQGYEELIKEVWNNHFEGSTMFRFVTKLKNLKKALKHWTKETFSSTKANILKLSKQLEIIQSKLNQDMANEELQSGETVVSYELSGWLDKEELELRQKSRQLWLQQGDRNTKFFYNAIKHRISTNNIRYIINQDGTPISSFDKMKMIAPRFYEDLFNQTSYWNVFPKVTVKKILTVEAKQWLVKDINHKEIKEALFQMNPDKAPGPDGFNAYFYQHNWSMIKDDVIVAVKSFFSSGKILKQINHTFLTLVPKSKEATSIQDYRPISCCNVIYKIISKILSNRLKLVVGELISNNQHAFLQGRQIGECSLLAHELLRDFSKKHGKRACFKIDLHKAFDSINREFVYYIMHCMGFPPIWINWIKECLSTPSFSVLLNGSSTGFFQSNRDIRQGDPLSPYIFVLVMEFWSISMEVATISGKIQNIKKNHNLQVSHLLFADDMLVFCRANRNSFEGINNLLESLTLYIGLSINKSKSRIFFSKGCRNKDVLSSFMGISRGYLPVKYLGLPLSFNYPKAKDFLPLIDKVRRKIEGWITYSLSFAGRIELIKSVLYSTIAYWYFVYKFPNSIVHSLESIFANFLWKGKLHTINWKDICRPKKEGGFGLRKLNDLCHAAGIKLIWRLITTSTLWSNWMKFRYVRDGNFWDAPAHAMDSGTWKFFSGLKSKAMCCIRKSIGNGETTSLWFDPWVLEGRLSDTLYQINPHLTGTEDWSVAHIIQQSQWHVVLPCLFPIIQYISNIKIIGQDDQWFWLPNANGKFTFESAWNQVRTSYPSYEFFNVVWFPSSNPKMACCMLKSLYNRLATRDRLFRFGIISAVECVLCSGGIESRDHLYFQCPYSAYIWKLCKLKLQLDATVTNDLRNEALEIQSKFKLKDKTYILSRMVLNAAVWHIWQERNRRIFQAQQLHKVMVFRRLYEDINVLLRTCTWKTGNNNILANWESAEKCN